MTNLIETPVYEAGIFQLETTTPVIGGQPAIVSGSPVAGHSNAQALQLANRTAYLKGKFDDLSSTTNLSKGTGLVGNSTTTFKTTAEMIAATGMTSGRWASTYEYATGTGGCATYFFTVSGSPPATNNVTIFRSTDGTGYWTLDHKGQIYITQAGVVAGSNGGPALNNLNTVLASSSINKVIIPAIPSGQFTTATQVLMSRSNITYEFFSDIVNTSTSYTTPLIFSHDLNAQPTAALTNVTLIGNGRKIDGNGAAILAAMGLGPGVLPPTFSPAMFNYIDNLKVHEVDFANGVYDSCNLRQCRNHKLTKCTFRDATQYLANGLNITTNWATYVRGDYRTYSYGVVEDCIAYNNASMGMTYYHCSGGTFRRCVAHNNGFNNGSGGSGSGFSYESPTGPFSIKYADGRFENCHSNNNGINGYYINTPGVVVDPNCTSMGNGTLGLANDVSGLQMCGVCVSGADEVFVYGSHRLNARHGVTFLGAVGLQAFWKCGGDYQDNAGSGINIQGIYRGGVEPGTQLIRNGRVLIGGQFLPSLSVSNSAYNINDGTFTANGLSFDSGGARDINVGNVKTVTVKGNKSYNPNDMRTTTGGTGFNFGAITNLFLQDNFLDVVGNGWTTNGYVVGNDVTKLYQYSNKSNQLTGTVLTNNASNKFGISGSARISTGAHTILTTLPATGTATLDNTVDVLATLIESLKDGLMQG